MLIMFFSALVAGIPVISVEFHPTPEKCIEAVAARMQHSITSDYKVKSFGCVSETDRQVDVYIDKETSISYERKGTVGF